MILGLHTGTPVCTLRIDDDEYVWDAGRGLAKGLLAFLTESLEKNGYALKDLTGLVVFKGPGSFTGLRIGITVMNTLADGLSLPIVGESGDDWFADGSARLAVGANDRIVLPDYGSEPHITAPKK